ncbi:oxaloacetate decarboxylase alpha chain, partial [Reticulomyxa filosa]
HYQAAITFTSHSDPTLFNVRWVADIAKEFGKLGAHSICIKDMAGIASPALMKAWVSEIKDAVPELPVVIHAHYTTGFSPITYLMAIEAGASAVDCGISTLSGRSGHPAMEVFNQVLADLGYDLGWDPVKALEGMKETADVYREYHPRYEFCEMKMAGSVDYRVFTQGIPGGQISIMRNELVKNKLGHLFDKVIEQIQRVRTQAGGVALVTPTSEHVARQAIVNAMNGQSETTDKSPLWPGYSEMLRGVMGKPPGEMQVDLQLRALREWTDATVKKLQVTDDVKNAVSQKVNQIVDYLWSLSFPIQEKQILDELVQRIRQCRELNGRDSFIANQKYQFDERIKQFEKHVAFCF